MSRLRAGRSEFSLERPGNDFSGMTFRNLFMHEQQRANSFFNGVDFVDCAIDASDLSHCEFSEASFEACEVRSTRLDNSDLIDSSFENCQFERCSFETGEWRTSKFRSCRFVECDFERTTIALTEFYGCEFDGVSLRSLERRSVYFNVFSGCTFEVEAADTVFASRNFGVRARPQPAQLVGQGALVSLEQLCHLRNQDLLRVSDLVGLVEATLKTFDRVGRRRGTTFDFVTLIIRAMAGERRISPSSLIYIEGLVTDFAAAIEDTTIFQGAMALIIEIRSLLYEIATTEGLADGGPAADPVDRLTITFKETFTPADAEFLARGIAVIGRISPAGIKIERFENGSTFIEMATAVVISLGPLLIGLNFLLRQATITVERIGELRRAVLGAVTDSALVVATSRKRRTPTVTRVRAVIAERAPSPEIEATRSIVKRSGRKVVDLDTRAEVYVRTQEAKLG